jgi:tetratricopeptide (TPR) repeat protein
MPVIRSLFFVLFAGICLAGCAGGAPGPGENIDESVVDPDSLVSLGRLAAASDDFTKAKSMYDAALDIDPDCAPALRGLADLALETGDPTSAVFYFETLTTSASATPEDFGGLAGALVGAGRVDEAIERLGATARRFPNEATIQSQYGLLLLDNGRTEEAVRQLERAVELGGTSTRAAHRALGRTLFDMERYREAASALESYDRRYPGDFEINMELAFIHFDNGAFDDALPRYRAAVDAKPTSVDARVGLATTLEKLGRTTSAIRAYDKAIEIRGFTAEMERVIIAQANLLNQTGKYERTLDLVARAGAAFPETPGLACARGMALAGEGRYDEAVNAFARATGDTIWSEFANEQIRRIQSLR